jgi:hypothetical protein
LLNSLEDDEIYRLTLVYEEQDLDSLAEPAAWSDLKLSPRQDALRFYKLDKDGGPQFGNDVD